MTTTETTEYPRTHGVKCPECQAVMMDPTPQGTPGDETYYCDGCGFDLPTAKARPKADDYQADWDTRHANACRFNNGGTHVEECFLCGRGLTQKGLANAWWIHLVTDGTLTTKDDETPESQGCFPVGSECAKKIARPFKFKMGAGS